MLPPHAHLALAPPPLVLTQQLFAETATLTPVEWRQNAQILVPHTQPVWCNGLDDEPDCNVCGLYCKLARDRSMIICEDETHGLGSTAYILWIQWGTDDSKHIVWAHGSSSAYNNQSSYPNAFNPYPGLYHPIRLSKSELPGATWCTSVLRHQDFVDWKPGMTCEYTYIPVPMGLYPACVLVTQEVHGRSIRTSVELPWIVSKPSSHIRHRGEGWMSGQVSKTNFPCRRKWVCKTMGTSWKCCQGWVIGHLAHR